MADYIKCTVLGYETVADSTGRKTAIGLPPGAPDPAVSFQPNDFPYLCEPGVEHHCLWASRPLSVEEVEQLLSKCRAGYEVVRCALLSVRAVLPTSCSVCVVAP